jgi:hypothetical protein
MMSVLPELWSLPTRLVLDGVTSIALDLLRTYGTYVMERPFSERLGSALPTNMNLAGYQTVSGG